MSAPLNLFDFTRAILHIDGDSFFASCEIAKNPALKGKPVITGMERGIVSSLSYEAKARGIKRAMTLPQVKKICPEAILLPSDYETYSLYSMRMFNIVRRFTSDVEEYSIDECFADLTGLQRPLNMSYEKIAEKIKRQLDTELGMTFSVGLAPNKVLAKVASKWKKPSGLTIIRGRDIQHFLQDLPVDKIWGIGSQTTAYLNKLGVYTSLQFARKDEDWVRLKFTKPHQEIWQELNGKCVYAIETQPHEIFKSISKTKTFTPASSDSEFVFSQLSKNIENAFIKARRHHLCTKKMFIFLKTQEYKFRGFELKLSRATDVPLYIMDIIKKHYENIFDGHSKYRSTGVILLELKENTSNQIDLFEQVIRLEKASRLFMGLDELAKRYGKHTIFLGSSLQSMTKPQFQGDRANPTERRNNLFRGEDKRKKLGIAMLGNVG
jgi:DNA polymerase-4/DNA polymerase V